MLDQINFPPIIVIHYMSFEIILEKFYEHIYNKICVILKVKNTDIRFRFYISNEVLILNNSLRLQEELDYFWLKFKEELTKFLFNPQGYTHCTPELILEKYFESYLYQKNKRYPFTLEEALKNPNIICGRGKGHKSSLITLLENDLYKDIFKETCIVFNTHSEKDYFLDRLSSNTYLKYRYNIVSHHDNTRGRVFSFYIFNRVTHIRENMINYMSINPIRNRHFIILGN